jgi:hypothetical protein
MSDKDYKTVKPESLREPHKKPGDNRGPAYTEKGAREVTQATGDPTQPPVRSTEAPKPDQAPAGDKPIEAATPTDATEKGAEQK